MKRPRVGKFNVDGKIGLMVLALLLLPLILASFVLAQSEKSPLAGVPNHIFTPPKTYQLQGLVKGASILRDKWGVSHIYGQTEEDLFFAQGFSAARDRLWQLDLWRRQGEGKLAETFGKRFLEQDKAARLFLFRGDLEKEFKSYHPEGKKILTAFTKGINAYVDLTLANPDLLPLEFKLTGTTPAYWTPESPLIRIFALTRNVATEVKLAQLVNLMGAEAVEKLHVFEPPTKLQVPKGLNLSLISNEILKSYNLARGPVVFKPEDIKSSLVLPGERAFYAQLLSQPSFSEADQSFQPSFESNNWTISGKLTATGHPILANDPHRIHTVPSLRYMAHLVGPGWNVIGAGEPALPGISIGHNERIANGLTIFSFADEEDLYVYDTNPQNPSQYLYKGRWEDMKNIEETFNVKGENSVKAQLKFTRHGPVIFEDRPNKKAYALRAVYLDHEGTAAYLASLRINQAKNWPEFLRATEKHYCPSLNMVYADVDGNIGWMGGSIAPIRPNWNGLLPVPGNGEYEWAGYLDTRKLPRIFNPKEGFFASANQYNVPEKYPYTDASGHEWIDPYRYDRIMEVLSPGKGFTIEDSMRLQLDVVSLPARDLVPMLDGLSSTDPDVNAAVKLLLGWDYVLSEESVPAAIYELWLVQLQKHVYPLYVPQSGRAIYGVGPWLANRRVLINLLSSPDRAFGMDPVSGRNDVLMKSLKGGIDELKSKLGPDMTGWQWGKLHHMAYDNALSPAVTDPSLKDRLNVGPPLPRGGDENTIDNTGYRPSDFRQILGASYRQVMDLGNWDNSVAINTPGQSGDPNSPHYRDLFPIWAKGKYFPLYYSFEKIISVTEDILILQPK
jgi:penicillin amidase